MTTAKRTDTGVAITLPNGEVREFSGRKSATAVLVGLWDDSHGGGWNFSFHKTGDAAVKAGWTRYHQSLVHVVPID